MGLELTGVHVYEKIPGTTNQTRLVRTNPVMRITIKDSPPIYIQGGRFYSEGGAEVTEFPPTFEAELAKVSPEAKAEVGLQVTGEPVPVVVKLPKPVATWLCPQCHESMPTKRKGVHVARHRKVERAGEV